MKNLEHVTFKVPGDPASGATRTEIRIWEKQVDEYVKYDLQYQENIRELYDLVWGQCSEAMRTKVRSNPDYATFSNAKDAIPLLKAVRAVSFNFQTQKYLPQALHKYKRRFYTMYQSKEMDCDTYLERFQNMVDVIEHCGGSVGMEPHLIDKALDKQGTTRVGATGAQLNQAVSVAKERYLAYVFLLSADRN